jgi:hypothetical protein
MCVFAKHNFKKRSLSEKNGSSKLPECTYMEPYLQKKKHSPLFIMPLNAKGFLLL